MKLPNARRAVVERSKIVDYLLNADHADNSGKAALLRSRGFSTKAWRYMAASFRAIAVTANVSSSMETPHGVKYILNGHLDSPSGKRTMVKTIWIVHRTGDPPRLVTVVPFEGAIDD